MKNIRIHFKVLIVLLDNSLALIVFQIKVNIGGDKEKKNYKRSSKMFLKRK